MYGYEWDDETGGIRLNTTIAKINNEPRPVYSSELDLLGFNRYWRYDPNNNTPYMWAEGRSYWYRGKRVATISGGNLLEAPVIEILEQPEPDNGNLKTIGLSEMVKRNREIIEAIRQDAIKKVYNTYQEYINRVDLFYVAFSGGKDSQVTLDIVQSALPHNEFKVLFGNTGMENVDTLEAVDITEQMCVLQGIDFCRAQSQFDPQDTWQHFGSPATTLRWCCNVHKTIPQIILLRNILSKSNFRGMAFIGVRANESASRSMYNYVSEGKKHRGQYSCNPIIDWSSAEVFLYIYIYNLFLNQTYKKGNKRAGCLMCPGASELNEYISRQLYPRQYERFYKQIDAFYRSSLQSKEAWKGFIKNGGWKARRNGRDLPIELGYSEIYDPKNKCQLLKIVNPRVDWKVWIKTVGDLVTESSPYKIIYQGKEYEFKIVSNGNESGYTVSIEESLSKTDPIFVRLLKNVFRKSACCIGCQECETECLFGCLHMHSGEVIVDDNCVRCTRCLSIDKGCLVYKSLEKPGGMFMTSNKSLNCYCHFAPKYDWILQYFQYKNEFATNHTLGSEMFSFFKRFLKDAGLTINNEFSDFATVIEKSLSEEFSWALMLVNLSYTPQINWYIKRFPIDEEIDKQYAFSLMIDDGAKQSWVTDVWSSLGRFVELPFNKVGLGRGAKNKRSLVSLTRTSWQNPDARVILYALYKFAEACSSVDGEIYRQFSVRRLLDFSIESDGVSPAEIFGLDELTLTRILTGLSANYPDFILAQFTHDLDVVTLNPEKRSTDVLTLFTDET